MGGLTCFSIFASSLRVGASTFGSESNNNNNNPTTDEKRLKKLRESVIA
jgi:hypothetical protein